VTTPAQAARARRIPLWRWALWWFLEAIAIVLFYVLLTPLWMGLRAVGWLAELRARRRSSRS
jgi:hypothetical protein